MSIVMVSLKVRYPNVKILNCLRNNPGLNVIKLFTSVIYNVSNKLKCLSPVSLTSLSDVSLMFLGKARSRPLSDEHFTCFTLR
jgi:hypothetical protein